MLSHEVQYTIYSGDVEYYRYGERHRIDGPAFVSASGFISWWQYDQRHRHYKHGPAIIEINGAFEYWIRGEYVEK